MPSSAFAALGSPDRILADTGDVLYEAGDLVTHAYFPLGATIVSLHIVMSDGRIVEAATIGREGAVGGVVSLGMKPAYCRIVIQSGGALLKIPLSTIEAAKATSSAVHDVLARFADCLIAQALQSAACAATHPLEARYARILLLLSDRLRARNLPLTQEALAETLGVARTYVTRTAREIQERGLITYRRGRIAIASRPALERVSCECYRAIRRHYERVAPGLYPHMEP